MNRSRKALLLSLATFCLGMGLAARSEAAGTYKFCAKWQYQFSDQNLGEDNFKYTTTYGIQPAAYTSAIIQINGHNHWTGYLDSAGCAPEVAADPATYVLYITASIKTPNGVIVTARPQETEGSTRYFSATRTLPGMPTGNYTSFFSSLGAGDTTAGAISLAIGMAQKQDGRFVSGFTYKIYTELGGFEGHYSAGAVYMGKDEYTQTFVSRQKSVVAHELGHAIQDRLFGFQNSPYNQNSNIELCMCDHIDHTGIRSHCLQSREHIGAAQSEGFAHYHAASLLNNPLGGDGFFAYYKEFRPQNGGPDYYPPVVVSIFVPGSYFRWMEDRCPAATAGTELDWMTFLYEVGNKTNNQYSITDIARAFKDACGGVNCTSAKTTTWFKLQDAVNARFGASSAKAIYWQQAGDVHGVNW